LATGFVDGCLTGTCSTSPVRATIFGAMSAAARTLDFTPASSLVGNLQDRLARQFRVQVADWRDTCRNLSDWEDRNLIESATPERLSEHRAMVDELLRVGEWIAATADQPGFEDRETMEQITMTLQDLRDSRSMWQGQIPESRRKEILRDCLNEVGS
jgi:hypothetical protein